MTVTVRPLTVRMLLTAIAAIEPSPNAEDFTREVETYLLGPVVRDLVTGRIRHAWGIESDGRTIGLVAHRPHPDWNAELLQALMIDHRFRGRGLSRIVVAELVSAILSEPDCGHVMWLVHPENAAMIHVSRSYTGEVGLQQADGYVMFVYP